MLSLAGQLLGTVTLTMIMVDMELIKVTDKKMRGRSCPIRRLAKVLCVGVDGCGGEGLVVGIREPAKVVSADYRVEGSGDVGFWVVDGGCGLFHPLRAHRWYASPASGAEVLAEHAEGEFTGQVRADQCGHVIVGQ